jgi:hypothetical protein
MTEPIQKKYEPSKEEIEIQKFIDENTIPATPAGGFHQDPAYTVALEGKSFRNLINTPLNEILKYNIIYAHLSQGYEPTFFTDYEYDKVYGVIKDKNPLIKESTFLSKSIDASKFASHRLLDTKTNVYVAPNTPIDNTTVIEFNTMPIKNEDETKNENNYNLRIVQYHRLNTIFNYKYIPIGYCCKPKGESTFGWRSYRAGNTLNELREEAIYTSNMNHLIYHLFRSYAGAEFQEYRVEDDLFDLIMKNVSDIITRQMLITYYNAQTDYQKKNGKEVETGFNKEFFSMLNSRIDSTPSDVRSSLGYCENNNSYTPITYEELLTRGSTVLSIDTNRYTPHGQYGNVLKKATEFICSKDVWGSLLQNIIKSLQKETTEFINKHGSILEVPYVFIIRGTTKGQDYFNYSDIEYYSANRAPFSDLQYAIIPDKDEYKLSDILINKL